MSGCVLHDVTKDECKAKGLYCFDPEPENYTECIALNNAFNLGVVSGVKKCTTAVTEQLEKYKNNKCINTEKNFEPCLCMSCRYNPPSSTDGKPCTQCDPHDVFHSCYDPTEEG